MAPAPKPRVVEVADDVEVADVELISLEDAEAPDVADDASSGSLQLGVTAGPLLTDVRCRLEDRKAGEWQNLGSIDAAIRGGENSACVC